MALALILLPSFNAHASWKTVKLATGGYGCQESTTKLIAPMFKADGTPYTSSSAAATACNGAVSLFTWLGTAEATPISKQLNANPDTTRSTQYPCLLADQSDCNAPIGTSIAWTEACLTTALGTLTNVIVGTPQDFSIDSCLTGANKAAATITFVQSSDNVTSCNADFSITGSSPNRKLHDGATTLGGGTCALKATYMGAFVVSATRAWNNVSAGGTDTTPPTAVTGISCTTGDTLASTCTWDAQMDPDDGVVRSGVQTYRIFSDLSVVDSLAAVSSGLTCDFTPQTFGAAVSGSPSATQGTGFSGAQWTDNARGYGLEAADSYYGVSCPVAGASVYAIARIDSIGSALTYNKAIVDIRNGTSTTAAHYACVVMRVVVGGASTYYLQRTARAIDGGSNANGATVQLPGAPPYYVRASDVNNQGACDYSTDGGAWTTVVGGEPITLNDSKLAVFGGGATSSGSDDAALTVVYGSAAVETAGRLSKTVTLTAGSHTLKVSSQDTTGNESAQLGGATVTVASGGSVTHKWNPGHYVRTIAHNQTCSSACDSFRHSRYPQFMTEPNVVGTEIWLDWKYMESDAGNDFSAGIAWLQGELAYFASAYPGKKMGVLLNIGPYGPSSLSQAPNWFPQYFVNAGCVYLEGSAAQSGGSDSLAWFKSNPTCLGYFTRMINAYGAALDTNSTLAYIRIQQETDDAINNNGISGTAEDTAWKNVAHASATAFPTTPIWIPLNWAGVETASAKEALILAYKATPVGFGSPDTQPPALSYACPSTSLPCVIRGLNSSQGGSSHDNCGEVVVMIAVELSEMGYNSVVDPVGGLTSQQVATSWNNDYCAQYGIWEPNFAETGTQDTMYWNGAHGQLWAINNFPITHTSKPSSMN
jgi:hypothetical protein